MKLRSCTIHFLAILVTAVTQSVYAEPSAESTSAVAASAEAVLQRLSETRINPHASRSEKKETALRNFNIATEKLVEIDQRLIKLETTATILGEQAVRGGATRSGHLRGTDATVINYFGDHLKTLYRIREKLHQVAIHYHGELTGKMSAGHINPSWSRSGLEKARPYFKKRSIIGKLGPLYPGLLDRGEKAPPPPKDYINTAFGGQLAFRGLDAALKSLPKEVINKSTRRPLHAGGLATLADMIDVDGHVGEGKISQ